MDAVRVYLDHAATAPVRPEALAAYTGALASRGNPSSLHADGQSAREIVESGREAIARALGADPVEVVLTGGGTESVNLGIQGLFRARRAADRRRNRIVVPRAEHSATIDTVEWLAAHEGAELRWVDVDGEGRIRTDRLAVAVDEDPGAVALVTALWANNEVGTLQPVAEIVALAEREGIPVHLDAVAALGQTPVDFAASGAAALSVSGHKVGAPIGTGALLVRRDATIEPILHGGGQQRGRSGTEDPAGAAALGAALSAAVDELPGAAERMTALRERLVAEATRIPGVVLHGARSERLPGNANLGVAGAEGESLLFLLDAAGISASTGAACRAGVAEPSHVLLAMSLDEAAARSALRISMGPETVDADVDALLAVLPGAVETARRAFRGATPERTRA